MQAIVPVLSLALPQDRPVHDASHDRHAGQARRTIDDRRDQAQPAAVRIPSRHRSFRACRASFERTADAAHHQYRRPAHAGAPAHARGRCSTTSSSGSYDEITLRANRDELDAIRFRQRVLVDTIGRIDGRPSCSGETAVDAGRDRADRAHRPGPWRRRDAGGARRRSRRHSSARSRPCRSARSRTCAGATKQPFWFQLYVFRDRGFCEEMIERAHATPAVRRCSSPSTCRMRGQRHADLKNGLTVPPRLTAAQRLRHRHQARLGRRAC